MNSIIVGKIKEHNKHNYSVSLYNNRIKKRFDSIKDAYKFADKQNQLLMETGETNSITVHYERSDKRSSYLIWEKVMEDSESSILTYEESEYDYVQSHKTYFKNHQTRRMINERYYSFHDFARVKVLTDWRSALLKLSFNVIAMILSVILLFYGLHANNMVPSGTSSPTNERVLINVVVIVSSISLFIVSTLASISYGYPIYRLKKIQWNYDEVDWRKMNRLRNRLKIATFIFVLIGISALLTMLTQMKHFNIWQHSFSTETLGLFILSIMAGSSLFVVGFLIIVNSVINLVYMKENLKKYFTITEITEYKKWSKFKPAKVSYKTDEKFYLFPLKNSLDIVLAKLNMVEEVERTSSIEDMKEYRDKTDRHYKKALREYFDKRSK